MKIRNIITTSALVVLLGLSSGSAYADDLGDVHSFTPLTSDAAGNVSLYYADAYQAAWKAAHGGEAAETASTDSFFVSVQVGDAGDNDVLLIGSTAVSDANESATTDYPGVSFIVGDAGDNDVLLIVEPHESEIASTDLN